MTKHRAKLIRETQNELGKNTDITTIVEWFYDNTAITDTTVRDFCIIQDYKKLKDQNPDSSKNSKVHHLEAIYDCSYSYIFNRVKDL